MSSLTRNPKVGAGPRLAEWLRPRSALEEAGERHLKAGNLEEAERCLDQAAAEAARRMAPKKSHLRLLTDLASARLGQKKFGAAHETVDSALKLVEDDDPKPAAEYGCLAEMLGSILIEEGNPEGAVKWLEESVQAGLRQGKSANTLLPHRHYLLGKTLRRTGRHAEARETLFKALELCESAFGREDKRTAATVTELAAAYQDEGRLEEAKENLARAVKTYQAVTGMNSVETARVYEQLAGCHHAGGDLAEARNWYSRALQCRERTVGADTGEAAQTMVKLAAVHADSGQFAAAIELAQQAAGRLAYSRSEALPGALEQLARLYESTGRFQDAAGCLARARVAWQEQPGDRSAEVARVSGSMKRIISFLPEIEVAEPAPEEPPAPAVAAPASLRTRPSSLTQPESLLALSRAVPAPPEPLATPMYGAGATAPPVVQPPPPFPGSAAPAALAGQFPAGFYGPAPGAGWHAVPQFVAAVAGIPVGFPAAIATAVPQPVALPHAAAGTANRPGGIDGWEDLAFEALVQP